MLAERTQAAGIRALFETLLGFAAYPSSFADSAMRPAAWLLSWTIFPLGARFRPPSDKFGARAARDILEDREARINLSADIFLPPSTEVGLAACRT